MRGLTDEERALLAHLLDGAPAKEIPEFSGVHAALIARGAARLFERYEDDGWIYEVVTATPLGELALRVDAAARAQGVRP